MQTVVLLHGLGARPWTLSMLAGFLWLKGYDTYTPYYPVDEMTFNETLQYVDQLLANRFDRDEPLILIGQSMGGVVAFHLHRYGWNIVKSISIGSPLHGANLLNQLERWLPSCVRDYLYKLPYDDLRDFGQTPEPPHEYHTITMSWLGFEGFDGCVYKDEAVIDKQRNIHLAGADHRTVFANPRLAYHVLQLLDPSDADSVPF